MGKVFSYVMYMRSWYLWDYNFINGVKHFFKSNTIDKYAVEAKKRKSPICKIIILLLIIHSCFPGFSQKAGLTETMLTDTARTKSGYSDLAVTGGVNSIDADLKSDDAIKASWLNIDVSKKLFRRYYSFKRKIKRKYQIAMGTDYMFLNQFASFSFSDKQASSGIYRFFSTWDAFHTKCGTRGSFLIKIENRHNIGPGVIPRNLGYEAGSALSTASFSDFDWGLTNLYWKQLIKGSDYAFAFGIMDPGEWLDHFPSLNTFKYYLSEAFSNSPTMALPSQGVGFTFAISPISNFYLAGGIHDANGRPEHFIAKNFDSFFSIREYFTWIEVGWKLGSFISGETVHVTYWRQDANKEQGIGESEGWNFSISTTIHGYIPFIRVGISDGKAPTMRRLIQAGISTKVLRKDYLGIGFHWGGPSDETRRDQTGIEIFYAFQLTQHLSITPDIQWTFNPSFNESEKFLVVYSAVRIRYAM